MKRYLVVFLSILVLFAIPVCRADGIPDPSDDFWYLDEANVLSEETEGIIFFANQRLYEAEEGAEIVVVTVKNTGSTKIEDYAYDLMNSWGIGGESHRGLLVLLAVGDEAYYTMPGSAVSGRFSSSKIESMQDANLEEGFAAGNYDEAVRSYFSVLYKELADYVGARVSIGDAKADYEAYIAEDPVSQGTAQTRSKPGEISVTDPVGYERNTVTEQRKGNDGAVLLGVVLLIGLFFLLVSLRRLRRARRMPPTYSNSGGENDFARGATFGYLFGRSLRRNNPPPPQTGGFGGPIPPRSRGSGGIFGGMRPLPERAVRQEAHSIATTVPQGEALEALPVHPAARRAEALAAAAVLPPDAVDSEELQDTADQA